MVSKGQICTGSPGLEDSYTKDHFETVYWTPGTSCSLPSPTNQPTTPMRDSKTSRRYLRDAYTPRTVFEKYSVEETLLSICDPTSDSLASPFLLLPRRAPQKLEVDDSDESDSSQSVEDMSQQMDSYTFSHSRTRALSTSRLAVAVKSHAHDARGNLREIAILKFIVSTTEFCPFVQGVRIQQDFAKDEEPRFNLDDYPTSLAHPEVSRQFCLSQDNAQASEIAVNALRTLAAELYLALSFLHRNGVVHQDVKPANIMISRDGHTVLGDFGAARFLPSLDITQEDKKHALKLQTDNSKFGKIVLQPEDAVTLTPLYAAPEFVERNQDGLLEYDHRVDWWSYGLMLYELATGRHPFQAPGDSLQDMLDYEGLFIRESDSHLEGFLRQLLIRDPASRLCGQKVKLHPFFHPLSGMWGKIKSLRHPPPCSCPPRLSFFTRRPFHPVDPLAEIDDIESKFPLGNVTILQPRSPYRESSSDDTDSLGIMRRVEPRTIGAISPCFTDLRLDALEIRRPTARIFDGFESSDYSRSPCSEDFDTFTEVQHGNYTSDRFGPSFSVDSSFSSPQPFPSTASIVRYHYNDGTIHFSPAILEVDATLEHTEALDDFDGSFNDSGLDLPLGESSETRGSRKCDIVRKPNTSQLVSEVEKTMEPKGSHHQKHQRRTSTQKIGVTWTLDEEIAITLLSAGLAQDRRKTECTKKRRSSTARLIVNASGHAMKSIGRRMSHVFLWR